jgi:hypothetical protein
MIENVRKLSVTLYHLGSFVHHLGNPEIVYNSAVILFRISYAAVKTVRAVP